MARKTLAATITLTSRILLCASSTLVPSACSLRRCAHGSRSALPLAMSRASSSQPLSEAYPALAAFLAHTDESYHMQSPVKEIHAALIEWYAINRRRLPWRGDAPPYNGSTAGVNKAAAPGQESAPAAGLPSAVPAVPVSAYAVWVSEIMCQQTRVEAVIPYWIAWMEAFPTVEALAAASEEEVNARWAGLGFYRRARMLHDGAKQVVSEFGGKLPQTVDGLMKLKGIGRYTAGDIITTTSQPTSPPAR